MNEKLNGIQNDVKASAHKIWLAGLGAMSLAGDEGSKLFKSLVEKGEDFESREKPPVEAVKNTYEKTREAAGEFISRFEDNFNEKVSGALQKLGVPTREELAQLTNRVEALVAAFENLHKKDNEKT